MERQPRSEPVAPAGADQCRRRALWNPEDVHGVAERCLNHQPLKCPRKRGSSTPVSGRDNPHISSTVVIPRTISGHGWWNQGTCTKLTANVYNCLFEYYDDNTWRAKVCSGTRQVYAGDGTRNRTAANIACSSSTKTSWRNHVDVDVINEADSGEFPFYGADVLCRVN